MFSKLARESISLMATATLLALCLATIGCSKGASHKVATDTKSFESASPALKEDWAKVLAATSAHDYATAILTCRKLQANTELTPEQREDVNHTLRAVNDQLAAAAAKGDPNSLKAIQEVRKRSRGN